MQGQGKQARFLTFPRNSLHIYSELQKTPPFSTCVSYGLPHNSCNQYPASGTHCSCPNHWLHMCNTQSPSRSTSRRRDNRARELVFKMSENTCNSSQNKPKSQWQQNSCYMQSINKATHIIPEEFVVQNLRGIHWQDSHPQGSSKQKLKVNTYASKHSHREVITDLHIKLPGKSHRNLLRNENLVVHRAVYYP